MVGKRNRFRRRLAAVTAFVFLFWCQSSRAENVSLLLRSGRNLQARVDFPAHPPNHARARFPVILVFGGFQKAGEVIELMRSTGLGDGYALASFDYPFEPPRRLIFPDSLFWIPKLHQMIHETFEGIGLLEAHLSRDHRVDPSRRILLGASLGAPMALGAVHRGASPTHLVLIHGFGDFESVVAWQFERPWKKNWGRFAFLAPGVSRTLSQLVLWRSDIGRAEDWARALPEGLSVLQVAPKHDEFVPRSAIESLENSLQQSRARVTYSKTSAGHLQPGAVDTLREIRVLIERWLASDQTRKKPPRNP